ncbi:hypothetical protein T05_8991 [Trichinella murrelli]|uniref:Uncharacterized protein n=1 Tax=Trichinella murrelli TaxID=144512 RepID=A0A0V0SR43_9BILA|nr:hypothetical protein T05_8991 [Trichinella murrelli]
MQQREKNSFTITEMWNDFAKRYYNQRSEHSCKL